MAFFSNQGTMIHSGAAGGPLRAFQDGSLGARRRWRRGPIRKSRRPVRSLYSIYNRRGMGEYFTGMAGGPLRSFQDGSLGKADFGPLRSYQDGSLGVGSGPMMSFKDGSLGMPLFLESGGEVRALEEPVTIHHGTLGEYFSGTAGCRGCGLGQDASASTPTLDLSNPDSVAEVKQAMVIAPWMSDVLQTPEAMADVEDPLWTTMTVQIVGAWVSGYVEYLYGQPSPPTISKVEYMDTLLAEAFEGEFFVPNTLGILNIYTGAVLGSSSMGANPAEAFPRLTKFSKAATETGEGDVLPPAIEGQAAGISQANLMAIGVGVAAVAVVGAIFLGSKKRK